MKVVRHVDTQVAGEDHAVIPVQDDEGPEVGRGVSSCLYFNKIIRYYIEAIESISTSTTQLTLCPLQVVTSRIF